MKNLQKTIEKLYATTPGSIVSVGYGFKKVNGKPTNNKAIVYGVRQKKPINELDPSEIVPTHIDIDGELVPTDVVENKGQFKALSNCFAESDPSSNAHRLETRPLLGGISIGTEHPNSTAGTLGGIVKDNENGFCCILSNNHVLAYDGIINSVKDSSQAPYSIQYERLIQPGRSDGGDPEVHYINYLKRYYPLDPLSTSNYIDAALSSVGKRDLNNTSSKFLGLDNAKALPFATSSEIDSLIDDDISLFKSGRTTGFTGGTSCPIKTVFLNYSIAVGGYNLQNSSIDIDFADAIVFSYEDTTIDGFPRENVVVPGDSGSFLIGEFNGIKKIVGLIFASGSFDGVVSWNAGIACRIDRVSELLNISSWNGVNSRPDDIFSWTYVQTSGLSDIIKYQIDEKMYWQIGTVSGVGGLDSLYMSSSNDLLKMCLLADSCTGLAPDVECPTPPPTPTPPPPPPPPTPSPPPPPRANFNNDADWNGQDGNVTSVGTNGKSSYYSTYDQNGNVWELTDSSDGTNKISLGGAWDSPLSSLAKCARNNLSPESKNNNTGLRLVRLNFDGIVSPSTIYCHGCSFGGGPINVVEIEDTFNAIETKRFNQGRMHVRQGCVSTATNNDIGPRRNGRAVFVYDNTIFYTFVGIGTIYKMDLQTGNSLGSIDVTPDSLSTIAYDGTYYYTADYSGMPYVYVIDPSTGNTVRTITMKIPKTIPYQGIERFMDGLEYFDGKLIMNRGDLHPIYDIYDLDGNVLEEEFINVSKALENVPKKTGRISVSRDYASSMGIVYDGTDFIVSHWNNVTLDLLRFSGDDGSFIGEINTDVMGKSNSCPTAFFQYEGIEDMSVDYDTRPDVGDGFFTEWSWVGHSGNAPDSCQLADDLFALVGGVDYNFRIQRYQLTNLEYCGFLNSAAQSDPYGLYDSNMDSDPRGGITRSGSSGSYTYGVKTNMAQKPVIYVNWFSGARLANWLHNKIDDPESIETETGAYTLNGATSGIISANPNARFRLPTVNEWHKAAYYKGSNSNAYWDYAMQTDDTPCSVSATLTGDGSSCA